MPHEKFAILHIVGKDGQTIPVFLAKDKISFLRSIPTEKAGYVTEIRVDGMPAVVKESPEEIFEMMRAIDKT